MGWRDWFRPKQPPAPVGDAELGSLTWSDDLDGWSGSVGGIRFTLDHEPDTPPPEGLKSWAREVLSDTKFLEESLTIARAEAPNFLGRFAGEMAELRYERLHFSEDSKGRYIFAELGPGGDSRFWRLEFDGRKCLGIGFDT